MSLELMNERVKPHYPDPCFPAILSPHAHKNRLSIRMPDKARLVVGRRGCCRLPIHDRAQSLVATHRWSIHTAAQLARSWYRHRQEWQIVPTLHFFLARPSSGISWWLETQRKDRERAARRKRLDMHRSGTDPTTRSERHSVRRLHQFRQQHL